MTTTGGQTIHPSTPQWFQHWLDNGFREFQEQNQREHGALEERVTGLESDLPARVADQVVPRVLDGVKDYLSREGGNAY